MGSGGAAQRATAQPGPLPSGDTLFDETGQDKEEMAWWKVECARSRRWLFAWWLVAQGAGCDVVVAEAGEGSRAGGCVGGRLFWVLFTGTSGQVGGRK